MSELLGLYKQSVRRSIRGMVHESFKLDKKGKKPQPDGRTATVYGIFKEKPSIYEILELQEKYKKPKATINISVEIHEQLSQRKKTPEDSLDSVLINLIESSTIKYTKLIVPQNTNNQEAQTITRPKTDPQRELVGKRIPKEKLKPMILDTLPILQKDLWKKLQQDHRYISSIVREMESIGLITRRFLKGKGIVTTHLLERVVEKGTRTGTTKVAQLYVDIWSTKKNMNKRARTNMEK